MDATYIKPIWPNVLVEVLTQAEDRDGTILANSEVGMDCFRGKVIAVGDWVYEDKNFQSPVVEGDIIFFGQHSGDKIITGHKILSFRHILAIQK